MASVPELARAIILSAAPTMELGELGGIAGAFAVIAHGNDFNFRTPFARKLSSAT
jgi:hypothetical protein